MHYKVSLYTYTEFLKENNTDKLTKFDKIYWGSPLPYGIQLPKLTEIFDANMNKLNYDCKSFNSYKFTGELDYVYFFKSKNGNEYRLDFVTIKENNSDLKDIRLHNKTFISVSFSIFKATEDDYDKTTNFSEIYDLMTRLKYLIDIHTTKIDQSRYVFMFGDPKDEKKYELYTYFIKICFPDYKLVKDKTTGFPKTDIGFYFIQ